jgi:hypothetical protein
VAVIFEPPLPAVSTVIELVPWPLVIVPLEIVQLNDKIDGEPVFWRLALKVTGLPSITLSGQVILKLGQTMFGWQLAQLLIFTVAV